MQVSQQGPVTRAKLEHEKSRPMAFEAALLDPWDAVCIKSPLPGIFVECLMPRGRTVQEMSSCAFSITLVPRSRCFVQTCPTVVM